MPHLLNRSHVYISHYNGTESTMYTGYWATVHLEAPIKVMQSINRVIVNIPEVVQLLC